MYFFWKFVFWLVLWISILTADYVFPFVIHSGALQSILFISGIILIIYGLLLNAVAGKTLKKFGHFDIKRGIQRPDKMIDKGIFSCMRHPAMFGSIFFSIGLSMLFGKIMTLLWAGWVSFIALYFIMAVEERETISLFGDDYCKFLQNRKPFSFSLSCLIEGIRILKDNGEKI